MTAPPGRGDGEGPILAQNFAPQGPRRAGRLTANHLCQSLTHQGEAKMRKPSMTKAKETKPEIDPAELTAAEFARFKNTALKFWIFCGRPRCQRGKSCLGPDALNCFDQCWARVPEPQKFWIREAIKARAAGLSLEDTMKKAD